jgi:hypothetical protein
MSKSRNIADLGSDDVLETSDTGINVTGTITSDGLTVDGDVEIDGTAPRLYFMESDATDLNTRLINSSGALVVQTSADAQNSHITRLKIDHATGDVNFYEDTGTTAKFFWDASAESLGIGTSSPAGMLDVTNGGAGQTFQFKINSGDAQFFLSPDNTSANQDSVIQMRARASSSWESAGFVNTGGNLRFFAGAGNVSDFSSTTEAMRIDSSQNVLVGKTSSDISVNGFETSQNGNTSITRTSGTANVNYVLLLNRLNTDGTILDLRKDSTNVGSIGVNGGIAYVSNASGGGLRFHQHGVQPCDTSGSGDDNSKNLGSSTFRFDNIYATNSTIQTSDRNEKQDIASLTPTEMLVAARLSTGFKNFKWKDRVAEKGDDARLHAGAIAQDVQDSFTAEGLDAGNYAMFISGTWWEHEVDVPAVDAVEGVAGVQAVQAVDYAEAVEATYDEEGIELTAYVPEVQAVEAVVGVEYVEAVEAKDAYTRTDTYDTLEEAPEGSTERTRLGIRYPELLSFVAAYNEQRFASIETRLTALEA